MIKHNEKIKVNSSEESKQVYMLLHETNEFNPVYSLAYVEKSYQEYVDMFGGMYFMLNTFEPYGTFVNFGVSTGRELVTREELIERLK